MLPGTGEDARNQLGWVKKCKTEKSGVWFFRGVGVGRRLLRFLLLSGSGVGRELIVRCGQCFRGLYAFAHMRMGGALLSIRPCTTASGHMAGYRSPDDALVC